MKSKKSESQKKSNSQTFVETQIFYSEPDYYQIRDPFTFVFTFISPNGRATWHELRLPFSAVSAAISPNGQAADYLLFLRRTSPLFSGRADVSSPPSAISFSDLLAGIASAADRAVSAAEYHSAVVMQVTVHTVSGGGEAKWRGDVTSECHVCKKGFKAGSSSEVTWMPCWHGFHRDCIYSSLKRDLSCPTCHSPVFPTTLPLKDAINLFFKSRV